MALPYLQVSRDASVALTEFGDQFRAALALGDFTPWAAANGLVHTTDALKSVFPVPIGAAGYSEFKGDMKYRRLYERSLSMKAKQWQDGVEVPAIEIEVGDFIGWAEAPSAMAAEWLRLPNVLVGAMLEANPNLDFYRDNDSSTASARALFASDHPFNVLDSAVGTWNNDTTTTAAAISNGTFFDTIEETFRKIKGPNGRPLGLKLAGGTALVPPHRASLFKKALENDSVIRAVSSAGALDAGASVTAAGLTNNIWKSTIGYTVADEFTSDDYVYMIAAPKPGLYPWIAQQGSAPEEFVHDKSSEKYKATLKVGVAYVGMANVAAALPHRIIRAQITG